MSSEENAPQYESVKVPLISAKLPVSFADVAFASSALGLAALIGKYCTEKLGISDVGIDYNDVARLATVICDVSLVGLLGSTVIYRNAIGNTREIDFLRHYKAGLNFYRIMTEEHRNSEIKTLTEKVNDEYTPKKYDRQELAEIVNEEITKYIASITGERIETTSKIRKHGYPLILLPGVFLGAINPLDGEIYVSRDCGVFQPHIFAHELAHRKGYYKEMAAQVLAYFALVNSEDSILVQSANCERLYANIIVISDKKPEDYLQNVKESNLRTELKADFINITKSNFVARRFIKPVFRKFYDLKMMLTGQDITDYDLGFTNFLYTDELPNGVWSDEMVEFFEDIEQMVSDILNE